MESDDFVESDSSGSESNFDDSDAESGSDFGDDGESDEGDDWDELERKAAKGAYSCPLYFHNIDGFA